MDNNGKRMPPLPVYQAKKSLDRKEYTYSELVNNNINFDQVNSIVISVDDLSNDMSKLFEFIKYSPSPLKFKDFESVLYVDSILKEHINNTSYLIADSILRDRSYVDLTKLKNISLTVPFDYLVWGVKFNDKVDTYCFSFKDDDGLVFESINGNKKLSYDNLIKIRNKIEELSKLCGNSDTDKVLLISDYIQSCTQFIDGKVSESSNGTFVTPDFPTNDVYRFKSGLVETVLNDHNGICMGIANLSTLLLNNDEMKVEVESVKGENHVWNKVLIDGKYYYFDNTWCITRSEDISSEGLITLSFSKKYTLFGNQTANSIGHHKAVAIFSYRYDGVMSEDDFDLSNYNYESKFTYNKHPIYHSERMH